MSEDADDQFDRLLGSDANRPTFRPQLSRENREWIQDTGADLDTLVRVARLRYSHGETWQNILSAVTDGQERAVLVAVRAEGGSARYDDIEPYTRLSRRRLRERIDTLVEAGILRKGQDRAVWVQWESEGVRVLVEDALSLWFRQDRP